VVGYRNPPLATRFQKGQSGNPAGRPKKLPSFRDVLESELAEKIRITEDDLNYAVTKQQAIAKALVAAALRGDMRAITAITNLTAVGEEEHDVEDNGADRAALESYVERELARRWAATETMPRSAPPEPQADEQD
jgi:Family of unknown function (DUF5681)